MTSNEAILKRAEDEIFERHCRYGKKRWIPESKGVVQEAFIVPLIDIYRLMCNANCPRKMDEFSGWLFEEILPVIEGSKKGFADMTQEELEKYELQTGSIVLFDSNANAEYVRGISFQRSYSKDGCAGLFIQVDGLKDVILLDSTQIDVLKLYLSGGAPL